MASPSLPGLLRNPELGACIRDAALADRGLRVVRVDADLVECDLDGALAVVRQALVAA